MDLYALVYDVKRDIIKVMPLALVCDVNIVNAGRGLYRTNEVLVGYAESEEIAHDIANRLETVLWKAYREHRELRDRIAEVRESDENEARDEDEAKDDPSD